jgi:hypothetical protein
VLDWLCAIYDYKFIQCENGLNLKAPTLILRGKVIVLLAGIYGDEIVQTLVFALLVRVVQFQLNLVSMVVETERKVTSKEVIVMMFA